MSPRAALYLRVSTETQDVEPQRLELRREAERRGWEVVAEYVDEGLSGSLAPHKRPALKALLADAGRRRFDVVAAVAVDRVSRSLHDLLDVLMALQAAEVALVLSRQGFDTSGPLGRAMLSVLGTFAELEGSLIRARVKAGLERARVQGTRSGRPIGGQPLPGTKLERTRDALRAGQSVRAAARAGGVSVGTAQRLRAELRGAVAAE